MRKVLFSKAMLVTTIVSICLFVLPTSSVQAQMVAEEIELNVAGPDYYPIGLPHGKSPVTVPSVWLVGHTIEFHGTHNDFVLNLFDEDDVLVYTTFVSSTTMQVVLPSTLSGDFELRLYSGGSYYFYGFISL